MRGPIAATALALLCLPACHSSTAPGFDALPVTAGTVQAAVEYFSKGPDSVKAVCGSSYSINCATGSPGTPIALSLTRTADTVTALAGDTFHFSVRVKIASLQDIPVTVPVVGTCNVGINTAPGPDSVVQIAGIATFSSMTANGPIDRVDIAPDSVSLVTADDITISGGSGCALANIGLSFVVNMLQNAIAPPVIHLCGAPGSAMFELCPAGAPPAVAQRLSGFRSPAPVLQARPDRSIAGSADPRAGSRTPG